MKIKLLILIALFVPKLAFGAVLFVDFEHTGTINGNATTTPYTSIQAFANAARSAGDCAFVRNGRASTTNMSDITFTSDGTLNSPICLSGDLDNLWNTFATSTQTATLTFGSTTITMSASTTGIVANDWIYVAGDCYERVGPTTINPCVMEDIVNYYEVQSLTGSTITLYKPYRGNNAGAGKDLRILGKLPQWGITTTDFQWVSSADNYWIVAGFDIRGTDSVCNINETSSLGFTWRLLILQTDGTTACSMTTRSAMNQHVNLRGMGGNFISGARSGTVLKDVYHDCNNVASTFFVGAMGSGGILTYADDIIVVNCPVDWSSTTADNGYRYWIKNYKGDGVWGTLTGAGYTRGYFTDYNNSTGTAYQISNQVSANANSTTTVATTTNLRVGGASQAMYVFPPTGTGNTGLSTNFFPDSFIKLFEYPVYSDGSSKTYSMYFQSASTSAFTTDPTASQMWLECEYYGGDVNAERIIKKSTGVLDFNGSSSYQSLSVTCDPGQSGQVIIRGWYGKPREAPTNEFRMDLKLETT